MVNAGITTLSVPSLLITFVALFDCGLALLAGSFYGYVFAKLANDFRYGIRTERATARFMSETDKLGAEEIAFALLEARNSGNKKISSAAYGLLHRMRSNHPYAWRGWDINQEVNKLQENA